jgi:spore coat polysaccharide biosynthesis predicted glycosyltransferase SpsG/RimJ/RimL family protein N-acetyltransferase
MTDDRAPRVLAHCNAGREFGLGHLMRVLAVAEEAVARGWAVRIAGDLDDAALARIPRAVPTAVAEHVPLGEAGSSLRRLVGAWRPSVLHLDTYWLDEAAVPAGPLVSNVQDAPFGVRPADLVIDPNLGAESRLAAPGPGRFHLVGTSAMLVRRQVRDASRAARPERGRGVLVVLGGTDPHRLTTRVVEALARLREPPELTVVTPPDQLPELQRLAAGSRGIRLTGFLDDLPAEAAAHDLVVSAAGTSVWDLAHLGVPTAIVAVTENQRAGYAAAVAAGITRGLGLPPHSDLDEQVAGLAPLLADRATLARQAERGRALVDGLGTWRVVSAWEQLAGPGPIPERPRSGRLAVRSATPADARLLLDWRNDPATRGASRTTGEISWEDHSAWLEQVLADPGRQLLVVSEADRPIASVRWDSAGDGSREVSIVLAPAARGRGLAAPVLTAAEAAVAGPLPVLLTAAVHRDNPPSLRLFARCGYLPHQPSDADGFLGFAKWRFAAHPRGGV